MIGAIRDIGVSTCLGLGAFYYFAKEDGLWYEAISLTSFSDELLRCVLVLSWPYLMFYFIWNHPSMWMSLTSMIPLSLLDSSGDQGKRAVGVFSKMASFAKVTQMHALLKWWISSSPSNINGFQDMFVFLKEHLPVERLIVASILLSAGQILNASIYYRIGQDGVYYGFKLGRTVPWCTKFPFNLGLRHPQYVGVVLNIWGLAILLLTPFAIRGGLLQVSLAWCFMYFFSSCLEESGGESKDDDITKKKT